MNRPLWRRFAGRGCRWHMTKSCGRGNYISRCGIVLKKVLVDKANSMPAVGACPQCATLVGAS